MRRTCTPEACRFPTLAGSWLPTPVRPAAEVCGTTPPKNVLDTARAFAAVGAAVVLSDVNDEALRMKHEVRSPRQGVGVTAPISARKNGA
jgi:hypothetical protein